MTGSINSSYSNINLSNFINNNKTPVNTNTQQISQNQAQSVQIPKNNNLSATVGSPSTKQQIISSIASIALLVIGFNFAFKGIRNGNRIPKKELQAMWNNLSNETGINDMALPKNLEALAGKMKNCINNSQLISQRGGKQINSILLYGPPGTGKTTFAKALAKMFPNSRFAAIDLAALNSEFNGVAEKNINAAINEVVSKAKNNPDEKIFVFIDEIDTVMMVDSGKNAKLSNNILNEFKKCFTEKLGKYKNIITIGATNLEIDTEKAVAKNGKNLDRPMLDRFEEKVLVDLPTSSQIKQSLISHYKDCPLVSDELKSNNGKIDKLCNFLSQRKYNISFRTLNSIYNDTASSIEDKTSKVTFENLIDIIKKRAEEFNISNEEMTVFLNSLK